MADFSKCLPHLYRWEGGIANNPDDPGGLTNRGIIWRFFQDYSRLIGIDSPTTDDLLQLTEDQTTKLYHATFWTWLQGDGIDSQEVAATVFDHFVNSDELAIAASNSIVSKAIRALQEIVNEMSPAEQPKLAVDGLMGPNTRRATNAVDATELFNRYQDYRRNYYTTLASRKPPLKQFLQGWLNRVNSIEAPS